MSTTSHHAAEKPTTEKATCRPPPPPVVFLSHQYIMKSRQQPRKEIRLQGTDSTPRKTCRDIGESSTVGPKLQGGKPVIRYVCPPKVIHADPRDFMALVQRLTGSSPRAESAVKREPAAQVLHPSTPTPSQSVMNSTLDENINEVSPYGDQTDMGAVTADVSAKSEEELTGNNPPNMACSYAEDHHISSPSYAPLHSLQPPHDMFQ